MTPEKIAQVCKSIGGQIKAYFAEEFKGLGERVDGVEKALSEIPAGKPGIDGKNGEPGPQGEKGADGERGEKGDPAERGEKGDTGADGAVGPQGVEGPQGAQGERGAQGEPGSAGEKGMDGARGADGAQGPAGNDGPQGLAGKDGAPGVQGKQGDVGAQGEPGIEGRDGLAGKDGPPGRDALELEVRDGIDQDKVYPRGTFAKHAGGLWRAFEATSGMRGWECLVNGIAGVEYALDAEDARKMCVAIALSDGKRETVSLRFPAMQYRGVFREGADYEPGDVATWGGNLWHCGAPTGDKPGEPNSKGWTMCAKRGRDGKDAPIVPPPPPAPTLGQIKASILEDFERRGPLWQAFKVTL